MEPSQPPVFALMVELLKKMVYEVRAAISTTLKWNMPSGWTVQNCRSRLGLSPCCADAGRIAAQPLWDHRDTPRDESWLEDVEPRNILVARPTRCTAIYARERPQVGSTFPWLRDTGRLASIRAPSPSPSI
ncbi:hypothetical protein ACLK19_23705 [Escherichia coli]